MSGTEGEDSTDNVKIFSTEDEKIRAFGELLTNDSSRSLFQILMKDERTALQLAKETGLSLPLVIYHLNKMLALEVIKVSRVETGKKGHEMKYYMATKFAIVIMPASISEKAKKSRSLLRSLNAICRFAGIGVAGVASWFGTLHFQGPGPPPDTFQLTVDSGLEYDVPAPESDVPAAESPASTTPQQADIPPPAAEWTAEESMAAESPEASDSPEASVSTEDSDSPEAGDPLAAEKGLEAESALPAEPPESEMPLDVTDVQIPALATGEDLLLPIAVTIAIVGAGLAIEMLYRAGRIPFMRR